MNASIENKILYEQLLQEAFLDTVKAYAKEKYNQAIDTISDWKDAAVVFGKIISNGELLNDFLKPLQRRFDTILKSLYNFLKKINLDSFVNVIEQVKNKILSLEGWKKLLAITALGSISYYVVNTLKNIPTEKVKEFVTNYLSTNFLTDILGKLTNWTSFVGILQPVLNGVQSIYNFLKDLLSSFSTALKSDSKWATKLVRENMDLQEYIRSLVQQELEEMSATGAIGVGAGPIMTANWVAPKGQKKNAATKQAEEEGWKVTKGETTMPSDSKVRDYKTLTGKKKKGVKIYKEYSNYDKPSTYGAASGYNAPSGYTGPSLSSKGGGYYASDIKENNMKSLNDIIDQELLNEVSYAKFKNEVTYRTKAERLHKAVREVKRKLQEIDRIVEYTSRIKQELSEGDGIQYWNRTNSAVAQISEMVNKLNNKIKNLNQ